MNTIVPPEVLANMKGEDARSELGHDRLARDTEPAPAGPELSTCGRCGLPFGNQPNHCGDFTGDTANGEHGMGRLEARVACRDRQIGTLTAFNRGCVRKLERVMESLNDLLEQMS